MPSQSFRPTPVLDSVKMFPILYTERESGFYKEWRFGGIPKRTLDNLVLGVPWFIHETDEDLCEEEGDINPFSKVQIHSLAGSGWEWDTLNGWKDVENSKDIKELLKIARNHNKTSILTPQSEAQFKEMQSTQSALDRQVADLITRNKILHHKTAIIRRILRYDHPTGKGLKDLQKIQHEIDLIIELENLK